MGLAEDLREIRRKNLSDYETGFLRKCCGILKGIMWGLYGNKVTGNFLRVLHKFCGLILVFLG